MNKQKSLTHWHPAGKAVFLLLALILALAVAGPVAAGGWAVISLDSMPGEIVAGEPLHLDFTVLQHGKTPVHTVYENYKVTPYLEATNDVTGESVRAEAVPTKVPGRFTLEVTFPTAGEWEWTIVPDPLLGETTFAPLTVREAATISAGAAVDSGPVALSSAWLMTGLRVVMAVAGAVLLFVGLRSWKANRQESVPVTGSTIQ